MGDLILTREEQSFLKLAKYKIFIDDKLVNEVDNGSTKVLQVKPGEHTVYVKVFGMKSNIKKITVTKKSTVRLTCGSQITGIKYLLAIIFIFQKNKIFLEDTI